MEITAEKLHEALAKVYSVEHCQKILDGLYEPDDPYYWLDWSKQDKSCYVMYTDMEYLLDELSEDNTSWEDVTPVFNRRGYWVVDPANPLRDKPEGLRGGAIVVIFKEGRYYHTYRADENIWNESVTAFIVVEP